MKNSLNNFFFIRLHAKITAVCDGLALSFDTQY
jgi:hypothetical protein